MYDTNFYNETCKLFLSKETCSVPYVRLSRENKAILRGAVVAQVNADCPECRDRCRPGKDKAWYIIDRFSAGCKLYSDRGDR